MKETAALEVRTALGEEKARRNAVGVGKMREAVSDTEAEGALIAFCRVFFRARTPAAALVLVGRSGRLFIIMAHRGILWVNSRADM